MANCLHKHLQLREDALYGCIVCGRPFVAEPVAVVPELAEALADPEPEVALGPDTQPAADEPDVDVSEQIRIYLTGKPREMPASARRRKAKRR